jgi:hypothetical protein
MVDEQYVGDGAWTNNDGPWESGVPYSGAKLGGLTPLETLISLTPCGQRVQKP